MVSLCLFHLLSSLLRLPPSFFVAFILHMEEGMQRIRTPHYLPNTLPNTLLEDAVPQCASACARQLTS